MTIHHLRPRSRGGLRGPRLDLCPPCHKQVHALFDNATLAAELDTVEKLRREPRMERFLRWVREQDPGKHIRVHRPYRRRR